MAGMCKTLKCLPSPGSLLEQDSLMIWLVSIVQEAWAMREEREQKEAERDAKSKSR